MLSDKPFFTRSLSNILAIVQHMAAPEGTTVGRLAQCLSVTRRYVFRLIRIMEHKFHIPLIAERKTFGGSATYRLPQSFVDGLSNLKIPAMKLTFDEAVLVYLLSVPGKLPLSDDSANLSMLRDMLMRVLKQS